MIDYIDIGPTPHGESCAQVGDADYPDRSLTECLVFKAQLVSMFPPPPGASIVVRGHPHDFGTYREVAVRYDPSLGKATDYAFMLEANSPEFWDAESLAQLGVRRGS